MNVDEENIEMRKRKRAAYRRINWSDVIYSDELMNVDPDVINRRLEEINRVLNDPDDGRYDEYLNQKEILENFIKSPEHTIRHFQPGHRETSFTRALNDPQLVDIRNPSNEQVTEIPTIDTDIDIKVGDTSFDLAFRQQAEIETRLKSLSKFNKERMITEIEKIKIINNEVLKRIKTELKNNEASRELANRTYVSVTGSLFFKRMGRRGDLLAGQRVFKKENSRHIVSWALANFLYNVIKAGAKGLYWLSQNLWVVIIAILWFLWD